MLVLNRAISIGIALSVAGCVSPPGDQSRQLGMELPETFSGATDIGSTFSSGWLDDFDDSALSALVFEAQERNYNLRAAAARLAAAGANFRIAAGSRGPSVSSSLRAGRNKRNSSGGFSLINVRSDQFDLVGNFVWEVDLWGRLLNRSRAALANYQAVEADYRAARLSLAANTAKAWFGATETVMQVRLAEESLMSFERHLEVIEEGYRRGVSSALDFRLSRANVATAKSNLEFFQRQRDEATRTVEVILGRYPSDQLALNPELPALKRGVPAGLPSELLHRRLDLVAAERRLAASDQRLLETRKNLLPSISLTASGGTSTAELRDLLDPEQNVWNMAGNLTQPLFQSGRLMNDIKISRANREEALMVYAQTVLQAFREVEDALAAENYLAAQEIALRISAEESIEAEKLALEEYGKGLAGIITVLESQRRSFNAQSSLIQVINQRLQNRLDLYLALGGDFDASDDELAEVAVLSLGR